MTCRNTFTSCDRAATTATGYCDPCAAELERLLVKSGSPKWVARSVADPAPELPLLDGLDFGPSGPALRLFGDSD